MNYSPILLAQSEKITNWLTPVWIVSVGITVGFVLALVFMGLMFLGSKIPGLNQLGSNPQKRNLYGTLFSIAAGVLMIGAILWRYFYQANYFGPDEGSYDFNQQYLVWILLSIVVAPVVGFGLVALWSKTRGPEILATVREGFLFWVSCTALVMVAFCLLGYLFGIVNVGMKIVKNPNEILESVGRIPYTGAFKKTIVVQPTADNSDPEAFDIQIWQFELKRVEVLSDRRILFSTKPLSASPNPDDAKKMMDIPASDEKFGYQKRLEDDYVFPDEQSRFDKIYIRNLESQPANVTIWWTSEPLYPEATTIPLMAVCVAGLFIGYFLLHGSMPKISAISLATFKNEISQPIFILLSIIGFVFILASIYIPYNTLGEDIKMYKEGGLTFIRVLAIFMAVWSASKSVAEEIEGRTALTVLSKPVGRRQFIVGKFGGIGLAVALLFILLGLWFVIWVSYKPIYDAKETALPNSDWQMGFEEAMRIIPGLLLGCMEVLIFVAISVAISTRLGILPNFLICFAIYVMGHLTPLIIQSNEVANAFEPVQVFGRVIAIVIPVLDHFDIQAAIMGERGVPLDYVGWCTIYCLMYGAVALLFALVLFEDRDLA